jgi:hypothetical protein
MSSTRTLSTFLLACTILALSTPSRSSYAQALGSCAVQGGTCVVTGGTLCAVAVPGPNWPNPGAGTCAVGENACACESPGYRISATNFDRVPSQGQTANSQVTVTPLPGPGFVGNVRLSIPACATTLRCTMSGGPACPGNSPGPCTVVTSTSQGQTATGTLSVTPLVDASGQVTFTISAQDASLQNAGPNGQPTVSVTLVTAKSSGGGRTAVLTFLVLMLLWLASKSLARRLFLGE